MIEAVFDSSVVVAGCGWRGESHLCLVSMARRRARIYTSDWILDEVERAISRLLAAGVITLDPLPLRAWFADKAHLVERGPTGKQRSRDPADDAILGTALAARSKVIVSLDEDL